MSTNRVELNRAVLGSKFQHRIIFVQRSLTASLYVCIWPPPPHPSWPILSPETSRSCCFQASSGEDRRDTADPVTVSAQRSQLALMSFVGLLFWICCHVSHAITLAGLRVSVFIILTTKTGRAFLTQWGFHTSPRAPFCLRHYKSAGSNCGLTKKTSLWQCVSDNLLAFS